MQKTSIIIAALIPIFSLYFMLLAIFGISLIGYVITAVCIIASIGIVVSIIFGIGEIRRALSDNVDRYSLIVLTIVVLFFLIFSIFFMQRLELVFFDENIYQSIALNIVNHGNALTCVYGSAQLKSCFANYLGFDPNGWPFIIAGAFKFFGANISTAYDLELLIGAMSIVSVFLLASSLTQRKRLNLVAIFIFSMIPELFIWSSTPANPDLPFMMFATLTTFFFLVFIKRRTNATLALAMFSLVLTIYVKVEALLLIPIFIIAFFVMDGEQVNTTFKKKLKALANGAAIDKTALYLLVIFLFLLIPEIYAMLATAQERMLAAAPFILANAHIFSPGYLIKNLPINTSFFFGLVSKYPIIFIANVTIFAIIGTLCLALQKRYRKNFSSLILLLCLFLGFFLFYAFYFTGSVLSGGSVRFMLVTYPAISILAAFGVFGLWDIIKAHAGKNRKRDIAKNKKLDVMQFGYFALVFVFFVLPFLYAIPFLRHPNYNFEDFPVIFNGTKNQYLASIANSSLGFIDKNYGLVPNNCLVFSEAPYLWYGLNKSSAVLDIGNSLNSSHNNYSCYVLDYDYWCTINEFNTSALCKTYTSKYKLKVLATQSSGLQSNFTLYQILNYTK